MEIEGTVEYSLLYAFISNFTAMSEVLTKHTVGTMFCYGPSTTISTILKMPFNSSTAFPYSMARSQSSDPTLTLVWYQNFSKLLHKLMLILKNPTYTHMSSH
jgi:hypothetical protein